MTGPLLEPQRGDVPHAEPTDVSAPFWLGVAEGRLLYQVCTSCEAVNAPPTEVCRDCQLGALQWVESGGHGALYSWTVVHRPVTPAFTVPYAPAIVDLDEGFQVVSNLIGIAPDAITAGMRLELACHRVGDALTLPYFRPATRPGRDTSLRRITWERTVDGER